MKLTASQRRYMRRALYLAIDYDEALIDAYRCAWAKRGHKKVLSEEGRKVAARCRRNIAGFKKLLAAIDSRDAQP